MGEDLNAEKAILRTPCDHYFHKDCLGEWLKLAKTCPICRSDLDEATEELSTRKAVEMSGEVDVEIGAGDLEECAQEPSSSSSTHIPSQQNRSSTLEHSSPT